MRTTSPSVQPDSGFLGQFAAVNGALISFICVSSLFHLQAQVFLHAVFGTLLILVALAYPRLPRPECAGAGGDRPGLRG